MTIPDEAVQAALNTIDADDTYVGEVDHCGQFVIDGPINIKAMLTAALPFLTGVKVDEKPYVDCACTKRPHDESGTVGYPSLLCEICDGKGIVPYVKLDGPELWEIVFGIANEVAHEISDEQYTKIAEAINSVFIEPVTPVSAPPPRAQALEEAFKAGAEWCDKRRYVAVLQSVLDNAAKTYALSSQPVADGSEKPSQGMEIHGVTLEVANALVEMFGGEETDMTVEFLSEGHSGPGFYCWCTEYPEDGSNYLGQASEFSYLPRLPASPGASE